MEMEMQQCWYILVLNTKEQWLSRASFRRAHICARQARVIWDDDDDEIAYFTVRWKTRELVLSTAPETWDNTDEDSKTENGPISRGSQSEVSIVRNL